MGHDLPPQLWERITGHLLENIARPPRGRAIADVTDAFRTPDSRFESLPGFPYEPRYREVDGLRLAHIDEGSGSPVVFVHGEPTWSYLWRKVIPPVLEAGHRCIAPDHAGLRPLRQADRPRLVLLRPPLRAVRRPARAARHPRRDGRRPRLGRADRPPGGDRPPRPDRADGDHGHRPVHRRAADVRRVEDVPRLRRAHRGPAGRLPRQGGGGRGLDDDVFAAYDAPFPSRPRRPGRERSR